jgi:transcriptional regulator with XRE-family HTH domain
MDQGACQPFPGGIVEMTQLTKNPVFHDVAEKTFSNLGLTLSLFRITDGISLEDLADAVELPKGEVSRYLKGKAAPALATLARLLDALDVEYPSFFYALRLVDLAAGSNTKALAKLIARLQPEPEQNVRSRFPSILKDLLTLYGKVLEDNLERHLEEPGR